MATLLEFFNYDIETLGKIGVYSIHHVKYPKNLYVGSTGKRKKCNRKTHHGFYKRFYDHVRTLNLNIHHSKYLQNIVNKYGIEGLIFSILEICDELSNEQIFIREQYYINLFKPVYNSFNTGITWSPVTNLPSTDLVTSVCISSNSSTVTIISNTIYYLGNSYQQLIQPPLIGFGQPINYVISLDKALGL